MNYITRTKHQRLPLSFKCHHNRWQGGVKALDQGGYLAGLEVTP